MKKALSLSLKLILNFVKDQETVLLFHKTLIHTMCYE